jgi:uncharacterized protein
MLEIRPICENCGKKLANDSTEAMICSFECTFCKDCVKDILFNVCPNCGGGLEKRPTRPSQLLPNRPVGTKELYQPIDKGKFKVLLAQYKNIEPTKR